MTIIKAAFSKKRRLLEAFIDAEEQNQNSNDTIIEPNSKKVHIGEPINDNIRMDCSIDTSDFEINNPIQPLLSSRVLYLIKVKLEIFEQWELKKRTALEKIYESVDLLTNKEEKLEKLRTMKKEKEEKRKLLQNSLITNTNDLIKSEITSQLSLQNIHNLNNNQFGNPTVKKESNQKIEKMIPIGPNGTLVPEKVLQLINWNQPTAATRKLLMTVFDRDTLAFHTLTGKPSPAFMGCGRPLKDQLNPQKVADIIHIVTKRSKAPERDIRSAITTKCADENKMYKQRQQRRDKLATIYQANKENFNYFKHNMTF
ncbi:early boundary activity protein 1-like [Condylostylus longicornis]|uniref:early boundary activity protein 1-like n=1 Tax=Condylostylus longicornis TaxID=2530218 RepID=UPI00244DDA6E|nr:early boundary activity protein 1-like [Condylostylus longicornis]